MICPTCNTQNRDNARFCKGCGRSLEQTETPSAAVAPDQAAPQPVAESGTGVQQTETPASAAAQEVDIAQEPTLIISPETMIAYHQRRYQDSGEFQAASALVEEHPGDRNNQGFSPTSTQSNTTGAADQDAPESPSGISTQDEHEAVPIPPPPPPESLAGGTGTTADETPETAVQSNGYDANAGYPDMERSNTMPDSFEQPHEAQPQQADAATAEEQTGDDTGTAEPDTQFAVMEAGTMLQGRYEITAVIADNPQEHVYSVIDHQGYQRCWNCGSENNSENDDFCTDCGASLLDIPYIMHEYSAEQSKEDTPVLQGNIVNTFVDAGRTYVIEHIQPEQSAFPNGVHLLAASGSDAGNVRRSDPNEDSSLVLQLQRIHESLSSPVGIYIVADGMGGHDNGQLASRMTINVIAERMTRELLLAPLSGEKEGKAAPGFDDDTLVTLLHDSIEDANAALCEVNTRNKTDMGSTLTGFMIVGQHAFIVNVGDSRTYMVRGGQIYQLTTDHSLVGQLVASGLIEPDDVYTHPQRSQIYRSLGDKPNTQIDIFKQQLHPGDKLLSCCDGLWEMIRNPQIENTLNTAPDPQTACQQLIDLANENGGEDNITAVIVYVQ